MYQTFAIASIIPLWFLSACHGQVISIDVRYDGRNGTYLGGNDGTNSNSFVKGASPCLNYALGSSNQGEQTSAQWVRFAFHDFVTANTATGIDGMDASLGFGSTRGGNHGMFENDSLTFFKLVRLIYTTTQPRKTVSYSTTSATGNSSTGTSSDSSGTGTSIFGSTIYSPLNSTISPGATSLSSNNVSYPFNDNIFVLPAQPSFDPSSGSMIVKSAALTSASGNGDMTAVLLVPTEQEGTISPKSVQQNVTLTSFGTAGAHNMFSTGTIKVSSTGTVINRVAQGGSSRQTVKSTTFASEGCVDSQKVDMMWLGNESPHFGVVRVIDSQSYR